MLVRGFQLKPTRGWMLLVSRFGTGREREALVAAGRVDDALVQVDQAVDPVAGQLVAHAEVEGEARLDPPLVLHEEVDVVPVVVDDLAAARQRPVDGGHVGHVVDEAL